MRFTIILYGYIRKKGYGKDVNGRSTVSIFFTVRERLIPWKGDKRMKLSKYEQETIVNYNAGDKIATVYTRDKTVMRKIDALVTDFPEYYRLTRETDIDKTYEIAKSLVSYRRPRRITEKQRQVARKLMRRINGG